ncbi:hypothetical protein POSPLADRAFT_1040740 [Postia placenta MAD-698-R-SB12]|uniref:Secreted protein n=1 Tax=Postia placenta MAD-698-R-SB12 TaxID=670580 RepID=A0A1X6MTI3_9APHY|nr:hypothetical protein POSPLADRAFT_1040740 [Postia placenta MAD-698-R-SB12]OSX59701.1 hypothetical protein POSPLADRAFT_1040740 [Postia placenta MAD-698-R-SB12]
MFYSTLVLTVFSTLAMQVLSSPVLFIAHEGVNQVPLSSSSTRRKYENGELPPEENTPGWVDPRLLGGRLLDWAYGTLGEPLNVIISGLSDPYILTEPGLHAYAKSIGYSEECLGLHYGDIHNADLGDGLGRKPEQFLARQDYFPVMGTCWESVRGGHHFRAWRQNGTLADSGAWFLGASLEKDSSKNHQIVPNGYNVGRDFLVEQATAGSRWKGMWWMADVEWRAGLLQKGSRGVNHDIEQDGVVAILTVNRL